MIERIRAGYLVSPCLYELKTSTRTPGAALPRHKANDNLDISGLPLKTQ
jgi:hypothetical protein